MNVLLSIKPKYVDLILNGEKKYEFRRKIFRNETNKVYVYCTSPVKKIVAYFTILHVNITFSNCNLNSKNLNAHSNL